MNWNTTAPLDLQSFDPAAIFAAGLAQHQIANTAYPIAHLTTMRPYRVPRSQVQESAPRAWQGLQRLGLYVHVPFCEVRCGFCEYTVLDPALIQNSEDLYFDLLLQEFAAYRQALDTPAKTLIGFDIGGGTPSVASLANIARVLEAARSSFILPDSVIASIETTPKIAAQQPEKIQGYFDLGLRRISMGVQTINPRLLEQVGRSATSITYNRAAAAHIRRAGFERFNVDVMYGFAHQSLEGLETTLAHVIELAPDYITLYRTRYKGTKIASQAQFVELDDVNAQAALAKEQLQAAGYQATPGKNTFSRLAGDVGTSDYLTERVINGTPYLGLGLGAQSLSHHTLAYNAGAADKRLEHYRAQVEAGLLPIQDLYHLSLEAAMAKMISVSFYFGEIDLPAFQAKFGLPLAAAFPAETAFVLEQGLMEMIPAPSGAAHSLRLTARGVQQYNGVIALFYAGAVKQHLLELTAQGGFVTPSFSGMRLPTPA